MCVSLFCNSTKLFYFKVLFSIWVHIDYNLIANFIKWNFWSHKRILQTILKLGQKNCRLQLISLIASRAILAKFILAHMEKLFWGGLKQSPRYPKIIYKANLKKFKKVKNLNLREKILLFSLKMLFRHLVFVLPIPIRFLHIYEFLEQSRSWISRTVLTWKR